MGLELQYYTKTAFHLLTRLNLLAAAENDCCVVKVACWDCSEVQVIKLSTIATIYIHVQFARSCFTGISVPNQGILKNVQPAPTFDYFKGTTCGNVLFIVVFYSSETSLLGHHVNITLQILDLLFLWWIWSSWHKLFSHSCYMHNPYREISHMMRALVSTFSHDSCPQVIR